MTYSRQRVIAVAVAICLGMLGAVSLANADTLGLTPRIVAWLTIISTGLGMLQGFLPNVRGTDRQPEHIANRIMDLSRSDRLKLLAEVETRGGFSKAAPPANPLPPIPRYPLSGSIDRG